MKAKRALPALAQAEVSMAVLRPREDLFRFWRQPENLAPILPGIASITSLSPRRSRWEAKSPTGSDLRWEVEVVEERAPERLTWCSPDNSPVRILGAVRFTPATGGRGTIMRVVLSCEVPGLMNLAAGWISGESSESSLRAALRRFKSLMETGEIPTVEGQSSGRTEEIRS